MTSDRFFVKRKNIQFPSVFLEGEEHYHLSRVARIRPTEKVWLFDEFGASYLARVNEIRANNTWLSILEEKEVEVPKVRITLAQSLVKAKKMELILQKAVELGVTVFIPVKTVRSIVKVEEKVERKTQRWKTIALEASKQCGRSFVPRILPPVSLKHLLEKRKENRKLFLNERRGKYLRDILLPSSDSESGNEFPPSSVIVLIGPEGGWTDEEEQDILRCGFEAVSLGSRMLRAETAAICSLAMISHFWDL